VAADAGGNFVVAWLDYYVRDGNGTGVFARRFGAAGPCSPAPQTGCREQTAPRGAFRFREAADPARSRLVWLWSKGVETMPEDFGNPFADTDYALCVYDASADPQPIMSARAPAGGTCGAAAIPCWRELGGPGPPVEYFDLLAASDGLMRVRLKPGAEGKARVIVGGRGAALSLPELPLAPPVTVQLQASSGECWTATYQAFITKNADGRFRARPGTTTNTTATTTTVPTTTGAPTTTTTSAPVCGNLTLEGGEACDDGNTAAGDGCSTTCQCNPATAPPACDLTGTWTVVEFAESTVTTTEDAAGNSTTTGTVADSPFATQAARSGSCGSGTVLDPVNGLPFRFTVNDACDTQFHVVHSGPFGTYTLVRVP
jgi:cysteine-rich repeat protein